MCRPDLRRVQIDLMRRWRDDEVGERVLTERLESLHVHARELGGLRRVDDIRRQRKRSEVEACRERAPIHVSSIQAISESDEKARADGDAVIDRQTVGAREGWTVTPRR